MTLGQRLLALQPLDGHFKQSSQFWHLNFLDVRDLDMPRPFPGAGQQTGWVGQFRATRKAQVHPRLQRHDDTERVLVGVVKAVAQQFGGQVNLLD